MKYIAFFLLVFCCSQNVFSQIKVDRDLKMPGNDLTKKYALNKGFYLMPSMTTPQKGSTVNLSKPIIVNGKGTPGLRIRVGVTFRWMQDNEYKTYDFFEDAIVNNEGFWTLKPITANVPTQVKYKELTLSVRQINKAKEEYSELLFFEFEAYHEFRRLRRNNE